MARYNWPVEGAVLALYTKVLNMHDMVECEHMGCEECEAEGKKITWTTKVAFIQRLVMQHARR